MNRSHDILVSDGCELVKDVIHGGILVVSPGNGVGMGYGTIGNEWLTIIAIS